MGFKSRPGFVRRLFGAGLDEDQVKGNKTAIADVEAAKKKFDDAYRDYIRNAKLSSEEQNRLIDRFDKLSPEAKNQLYNDPAANPEIPGPIPPALKQAQTNLNKTMDENFGTSSSNRVSNKNKRRAAIVFGLVALVALGMTPLGPFVLGAMGLAAVGVTVATIGVLVIGGAPLLYAALSKLRSKFFGDETDFDMSAREQETNAEERRNDERSEAQRQESPEPDRPAATVESGQTNEGPDVGEEEELDVGEEFDKLDPGNLHDPVDNGVGIQPLTAETAVKYNDLQQKNDVLQKELDAAPDMPEWNKEEIKKEQAEIKGEQEGIKNSLSDGDKTELDTFVKKNPSGVGPDVKPETNPFDENYVDPDASQTQGSTNPFDENYVEPDASQELGNSSEQHQSSAIDNYDVAQRQKAAASSTQQDLAQHKTSNNGPTNGS